MSWFSDVLANLVKGTAQRGIDAISGISKDLANEEQQQQPYVSGAVSQPKDQEYPVAPDTGYGRTDGPALSEYTEESVDEEEGSDEEQESDLSPFFSSDSSVFSPEKVNEATRNAADRISALAGLGEGSEDNAMPSAEDTRGSDTDFSVGIGNLASAALKPALDTIYYDPSLARKSFDRWNAPRNPEDIAEYNEMIAQGMTPDADLESRALPRDNQSEFVRRFTDGDGHMRNPLYWNILGVNGVNVTPDAPKRLYEAMFRQEDARGNSQDYGILTDSLSGGVVGKGDVDDGSAEGRESPWMTGARYRQYVEEYGLPGRPVDQISDNMLYLKQDEAERYGFIPYLPDWESVYGPEIDPTKPFYDYFANGDWRKGYYNQSGWQKINNLFTDLANLRRDNVGFRVTDGSNEYDGNDFVNSWHAQKGKLQSQMHSGDMVYDPSEANEFSIPYTVVNPATGDHAPTPYYFWDDDRNLVFTNEAGTRTVAIWPESDSDDGVFPFEPSSDGSDAIAWKNIDPLTLSDGSQIRADRAWDIYQQIANDGPLGEGEYLSDIGMDNLVDYSGILGKSTGKQVFPEITKDFSGMVEREEILPWFIDMVLQSAPFFWLPSGGVRGLGRAASELNGINPNRNPDGSYGLITEDPTQREAAERALGSAIMPLTEHLWGPIGFQPLGNAGGKILQSLTHGASDKILEHPLSRWILGTAGEAAEEIPGNITEGMERSGLENWYHDTSETEWDRYGNPIYLPTSDERVAANFWADAPEALAGGGALGGVLGIGQLSPRYWAEYTRNRDRKDYENAKRAAESDGIVFGQSATPIDEDLREYYSLFGPGETDGEQTVLEAYRQGLIDEGDARFIDENGWWDMPYGQFSGILAQADEMLDGEIENQMANEDAWREYQSWQ